MNAIKSKIILLNIKKKEKKNITRKLKIINMLTLRIVNIMQIFYVRFFIKNAQKKHCSMIVEFKNYDIANLIIIKKLI